MNTSIFDQKLLATCVFTPKPLIPIVGKTPSTLLQQLHYYLQGSKFEHDGKHWVCMSFEQWGEILSCHARTAQRAFSRLVSYGLVIREKLHTQRWIQKVSFTIDYNRLSDVLEMATKDQDRPEQNDAIDYDNSSKSNTKSKSTNLKKQQTARNKDENIKSNTHQSHPVLRIDKKKKMSPLATQVNGERMHNQSLKPLQMRSIEQSLDPELEQNITEIVGHQLSNSFKKQIAQTANDVIQDALNILKTGKNIKNKAGLLRRAIENKWKPSSPEIIPSDKNIDPRELEAFNSWFEMARKLGLVIGSALEEGQLIVFTTPIGKPMLYEEMLSMFPISWLRNRIHADAHSVLT